MSRPRGPLHPGFLFSGDIGPEAYYRRSETRPRRCRCPVRKNCVCPGRGTFIESGCYVLQPAFGSEEGQGRCPMSLPSKGQQNRILRKLVSILGREWVSSMGLDHYSNRTLIRTGKKDFRRQRRATYLLMLLLPLTLSMAVAATGRRSRRGLRN